MKIDVKTSTNTYEVIIENNAINNINKYLNLSNKVLIVTDDGIPEIYIKTVKNQIKTVMYIQLNKAKLLNRLKIIKLF